MIMPSLFWVAGASMTALVKFLKGLFSMHLLLVCLVVPQDFHLHYWWMTFFVEASGGAWETICCSGQEKNDVAILWVPHFNIPFLKNAVASEHAWYTIRKLRSCFTWWCWNLKTVKTMVFDCYPADQCKGMAERGILYMLGQYYIFILFHTLCQWLHLSAHHPPRNWAISPYIHDHFSCFGL